MTLLRNTELFFCVIKSPKRWGPKPPSNSYRHTVTLRIKVSLDSVIGNCRNVIDSIPYVRTSGYRYHTYCTVGIVRSGVPGFVTRIVKVIPLVITITLYLHAGQGYLSPERWVLLSNFCNTDNTLAGLLPAFPGISEQCMEVGRGSSHYYLL
jgi:hypothetical protein